MKKKIWNLETTKVPHPTGLWISVKPRSGNISFSRDLVAMIGLHEKKVVFIQDEDRPQDWYLDVSKDGNAIPVRHSKTLNHMIQSSVLMRAIFKSCGITEEHTHRFTIGEKTKDGYSIITKTARAIKMKAREQKKALVQTVN